MLPDSLTITKVQNGWIIKTREEHENGFYTTYRVYEYEITVDNADPKLSARARTDVKAFRDLLYDLIDDIGPIGAQDGFSPQTIRINIKKGDEL